MENLELDLKLSVAQINIVLKYLGAGAYAEVAELIAAIHEQSKPQLEAYVAANPVSNSAAGDAQAIQ